MKRLVMLLSLFLAGCGNLSPRDNVSPKLEQDINNQQGRIDKIENNQNSLRADIDKMALINKENNNNGVQILQGDGGLLLIFGLGVISLILYYFYRSAETHQKTATILAEQILKTEDPSLKDKVLKAAEYTDVEKKIIALLKQR